jgi:hypothetical protein
MCTVSLIPPAAGRGLRVIVNRDERRTRCVAWGPQRSHCAGLPVIAPVDSESSGTWVAASGAGLAFALLNLNRDDRVRPVAPRTSRGHIIPALAGACDYDAANRRLGGLDVEQFAPFRLVITDGVTAAISRWNGISFERAHDALHQPMIFSSSSLGDAMVETPRRTLFDELLARESDPWRAQDRLHQHCWPDRRHVSVLMSRATACTVSRTVVVIADEATTMSYAPVVDGWIGPVTEARLTRVRTLLAAAG